MPEPDFDQIARTLLGLADRVLHEAPRDPREVLRVGIAEQLRQVWNARGAADIDALNGIYGVNGATLGDVTRTLQRRDR